MRALLARKMRNLESTLSRRFIAHAWLSDSRLPRRFHLLPIIVLFLFAFFSQRRIKTKRGMQLSKNEAGGIAKEIRGSLIAGSGEVGTV